MKLRRFASKAEKEEALVPYREHIENQKQFLTDTFMENMSKRVCGQLSLLMSAYKGTAVWIELCGEVLSNSIEFLNLCQLLDKENSILKIAVNTITQLNRLDRFTEDLDADVYPEVEDFKDFIDVAGRRLVLQDESEWFSAEKWSLPFDDDIEDAHDWPLISDVDIEVGFDLEKRLIDFEMNGDDLISIRVDDEDETVQIKKTILLVLQEVLKTSSVINPAIVRRRINFGYTKTCVLIKYMEQYRYVEALKDGATDDTRKIYISAEDIENLLAELE